MDEINAKTILNGFKGGEKNERSVNANLKRWVDAEFEKHFEPLPNVRLSDSFKTAIQALKNHCISAHQGNVPDEILTVLNRLRDGKMSSKDYQTILSLKSLNLSPQSIKAAEKGDFSTASSGPLKLKFALVNAFHQVLKEQGFARTALETVKDTFNPSPSQPLTKVQADIANETGKKYELRFRQYVYDNDGTKKEVSVAHNYVFAIEGAGDNALQRAKEKAEQFKHRGEYSSMKHAEDFKSKIVLEIHEVGAAPDAEPVEVITYETH